jgi:hypothetical protein
MLLPCLGYNIISMNSWGEYMMSTNKREGVIMADLIITNMGIKKSLRQYDYLKSISEYIWNGFDAGASKISINTKENNLKNVESISIEDNGYGINKNKLNLTFTPIFDSDKMIDPNERRNTSTTHGKNGYGRLTFFCFASDAKWDTVYKDEIANKNYKYSIKINENSLNSYIDSVVVETKNDSGTIVNLYNFNRFIDIPLLIEHIKKEFCWYLELNLNKGYEIRINGLILDYSEMVLDREEESISFNATKTGFHIKYVQWRDQLLSNEYSRYYFINSNGKEMHKETTLLNKKSDQFYHSIFITSSLFDNFDFKNLSDQISFSHNRKGDEFKFLTCFIEKLLHSKRKPFLKKSTERLIKDLNKVKAYPEFDKNNFMDVYRKSQLDNMIVTLYQAQPQIFSSLNDIQKKTFVRFLNVIMDSDEKQHLFEILEDIIELETSEKEELSKLLKVNSMSNIIRSIKFINDRYKAIEQLRLLVFKKDIKANEVYHIQTFIESHYWIFGEKYNLVTAAEPNFGEALRRYCYYLTGETKKKVISHKDKLKQMDIFAIRQDKQNDIISNIVIELKHPNILIGMDELNQVKKYMGVIFNQSEFNANNMCWEFYLIGNKFDTSGYIEGEIESHKNHGERSLVHCVPRYKIYVKTWSEIITEFELRHNFINEKLQLERNRLINKTFVSADEIVEDINVNSAICSGELLVPIEAAISSSVNTTHTLS